MVNFLVTKYLLFVTTSKLVNLLFGVTCQVFSYIFFKFFVCLISMGDTYIPIGKHSPIALCNSKYLDWLQVFNKLSEFIFEKAISNKDGKDLNRDENDEHGIKEKVDASGSNYLNKKKYELLELLLIKYFLKRIVYPKEKDR